MLLLLPSLNIEMMSEYVAGVASPRRTYRALDDVPTRPATDGSFVGAALPASGTDSDQPQASDQLDRSCSPTPSEIDALEESFCDLVLEPSQAETDSSQSSASDIQTGTTMTSMSSRTCSTVPSHPDSSRPLSDLTLDPGGTDKRGRSLGERLRLVWRR